MTSPFQTLLPFQELLEIPIQIVRVELTVQAPLRFKHFYHGNVIRSLLLNLFKENELVENHNLPPGIVPVVVENGYISYNSGDGYVFGIVLVGQARQLLETLHVRLTRKTSVREGILKLGKNVTLHDFSSEEVPISNLINRISRHLPQHFRLRFLTPLWIEREARDVIPGHKRYDRQLFRFDVLVRKIFHRLNNLQQQGIIPISIPDPPLETSPLDYTIQNKYLTWLEVPTRKRSKTYGGVVGYLDIEGDLTPIIIPLLMGQFLHIGEKINFGFGYYDLPDLCPELCHFWRPANTYLQRMVQSDVLLQAFRNLKAHSQMPGVDDVNIAELEEYYSQWENRLRESLLNQTYQSNPLLGMKFHQKMQKIQEPAIHPLIKHWILLALFNVLDDAIKMLFKDCIFAYHKNYVREETIDALRWVYKKNYYNFHEADNNNLLSKKRRENLFQELSVLFPYEPALSCFEV